MGPVFYFPLVWNEEIDHEMLQKLDVDSITLIICRIFSLWRVVPTSFLAFPPPQTKSENVSGTELAKRARFKELCEWVCR